MGLERPIVKAAARAKQSGVGHEFDPGPVYIADGMLGCSFDCLAPALVTQNCYYNLSAFGRG